MSLREWCLRPQFFQWWYEVSHRSMTLVEKLPEGSLYYYDHMCSLWVVVRGRAAFVSCANRETFDEISARVRTWFEFIATSSSSRTEAMKEEWRWLRYAAARRSNGEILTMRVVPGEWMGMARHHLPEQLERLPDGWPDERMRRVRELLKQGTHPAEA